MDSKVGSRKGAVAANYEEWEIYEEENLIMCVTTLKWVRAACRTEYGRPIRESTVEYGDNYSGTWLWDGRDAQVMFWLNNDGDKLDIKVYLSNGNGGCAEFRWDDVPVALDLHKKLKRIKMEVTLGRR
jgi:hypothetical protein